MSRRSRLALGAQTTRLGAAGMLFAGVANKLFDVELFALASVKLLDTDLDFRAKFAQRFDVIEQFSPELLLRRFGERRGLRHREFQGLDHDRTISNSRPCTQLSTRPIP